MADETPMFKPVDDALAEVAFSQPAVHADQFAVTERSGLIRIAAVETGLHGDLHFRGAVVISAKGAEQLAAMLDSMAKNIRERDG